MSTPGVEPAAAAVPEEPGAQDPDVVQLRVPADGAYLAVLRTAAAGLAARLQFSHDEIEDLRIAVDEACAMLLPVTDPSQELCCRFEVDGERLGVEVTVPTTTPDAVPSTSSLSWQVLTSLAGDARVWSSDQVATIAITARRREEPPEPTTPTV